MPKARNARARLSADYGNSDFFSEEKKEKISNWATIGLAYFPLKNALFLWKILSVKTDLR